MLAHQTFTFPEPNNKTIRARQQNTPKLKNDEKPSRKMHKFAECFLIVCVTKFYVFT